MNDLPSRPALHPPASPSPRPVRIATQRACSSGGYMSLTIGRPLTAVLICAGAVLMMSGAANAKASNAKASAAPALDAQAVNSAERSERSGEGRTRATRGAAVVKAEILLERAGF